jgi:hypothetical protein
VGERRLRCRVPGERPAPRQRVERERVAVGVLELEALDDVRERCGEQLLERVEAERLDRGLVGEHEVIGAALRGDRVGHAVEYRLELVARAAQVRLDPAQALVEPRVVHRGGDPVRQLAGERQVAVVVPAPRLRGRDRDRAERRPVRAERRHHDRLHPERLEQPEVVLVGRDRGEQPLVHLGVEARLAVAHRRGRAL